MRRRLLIACVLLALNACSPRGAGDDWFPLNGGRAWQYAVTTKMDGDADAVETVTLRTLGRDDIDGRAA